MQSFFSLLSLAHILPSYLFPLDSLTWKGERERRKQAVWSNSRLSLSHPGCDPTVSVLCFPGRENWYQLQAVGFHPLQKTMGSVRALDPRLAAVSIRCKASRPFAAAHPWLPERTTTRLSGRQRKDLPEHRRERSHLWNRFAEENCLT